MKNVNIFNAVKVVFLSLVIYLVLDFFGWIFGLFAVGAGIAAIAGGSTGGGFMAIMSIWLIPLASIACLVMYMLNILKLKKEFDPAGAKAMNLLFISIILMIVANVPFMPLSGFIDTASAILVILAFNGFRACTDLNPVGQAGAKLLFVSSIIFVVSEGIDFIPLMGWLSGLLYLVYLVLLILGWNKVKKSFDPARAIE